MKSDWQQAQKTLEAGNITVIPTDTLYGITADANNTEAVEEVYTLKNRDPDKPCIVLAANLKQITPLITTDITQLKQFLAELWPAQVSLIFGSESTDLSYLHRGKRTLAVRIPGLPPLRKMLKKAGPIIAPSANPQGKPAAENIRQAKAYFGDSVDYYLDMGDRHSLPSTIVDITDNKPEVLRSGAVRDKDILELWNMEVSQE